MRKIVAYPEEMAVSTAAEQSSTSSWYAVLEMSNLEVVLSESDMEPQVAGMRSESSSVVGSRRSREMHAHCAPYLCQKPERVGGRWLDVYVSVGCACSTRRQAVVQLSANKRRSSTIKLKL
jgi:hypothetical protein